jgi:pimeloyl-ACP methyl ester carboxylesterase
VTVRNDAADIALACTFLAPRGKGPFSAVLFLSGSGAQDRNEAIMGHQPFLVMADHLVRRGISSLRCDVRGTGGSDGNVYLATTEDAAADAEAGIQFLAARPEADRDGIGLIGHAEDDCLLERIACDARGVSPRHQLNHWYHHHGDSCWCPCGN